MSEAKNPWELEEEVKGYSVKKFYTKSTDGKGGKGSLSVTVPPYIADTIGKIVEHRTVPDYETKADFFRDALYHRMQYILNEYAPDKLDTYELILLQEEEARIIKYEEWQRDGLQIFEEALRAAKFSESSLTIKELIDNKLRAIPHIREPYRTRTLALIELYNK